MRKWITYGILALFCATVAELMLFEFLPSAAVYEYNMPVILLAVVGMALLFGLNWTRWKSHIENQRKDQPPSWWRDSPGLMAFGASVAAVLFIQSSVMGLLPHLIVAATGKPGAQEFVVDYLSSDRHCRHGVTVVGPPFLSDKICGLSRDFQKKLRQGSKIVVHGQKNWAGLIPEAVELK